MLVCFSRLADLYEVRDVSRLYPEHPACFSRRERAARHHPPHKADERGPDAMSTYDIVVGTTLATATARLENCALRVERLAKLTVRSGGDCVRPQQVIGDHLPA